MPSDKPHKKPVRKSNRPKLVKAEETLLVKVKKGIGKLLQTANGVKTAGSIDKPRNRK